MIDIIRGRVFVIGDNIDTDQIIPAQYLNLVPTIADEYDALGRHALSGLPDGHGPAFVEEGGNKSPYRIIVAGANFGCGSSREHAPIALGAAGVQAVVAQSYARIFFRNCIATGELYPVEVHERLCTRLTTGDEVEMDLGKCKLTIIQSGEVIDIEPLGDAKAVIDDGGLFDHARKTGMIT